MPHYSMIGELLSTLLNLHIVAILVVASLTWFTTAQEDSASDPSITLRLVDGGAPYRGRVEVYYQGEWGTVCDDEWTHEDGLVVCHQLGFTSVSATYDRAWFGAGTSIPIILDNAACSGSETRLTECPGDWRKGQHNCVHSEDAGVECFSEDSVSDPSITLRLVDGGAPYRGRVEVYYQGEWGTVCDDEWTYEDGLVVCRQLGFNSVRATYVGARFGAGTSIPIILYNAACSGSETRLTDCAGDWGVGQRNCYNSWDAGVECTSTVPPDIRLIGQYPNQGRVEIYLNGEWGTVCDDNWTLRNADVVCHQLGFSSALQAVGGTSGFGEGYGPIHLDDVVCNGDETSIYFCAHDRLGVTDCSHMEDAGVLCYSDQDPNEIIHGADRADRADSGGFSGTIVGVVIPAFIILGLIAICRKVCKNSNNNTQQRTVALPESATANTPNNPALEASSLPMHAPPMDPLLGGNAPAGPTAPSTLPAVTDLPPEYDSVMKDPSQFAFPPGRWSTYGDSGIPITPPPEYTPQTVVYNTDTNSVNMTTTPGSSTTA